MDDELRRWARGRVPQLLARAEAEAVAALRDALVEAALGERAAAPPPPQPAPRGDAVWAYGIVNAGAPPPADVTGVDAGRPVELVEAAGMAALVSRVPLAEFGAEPLRRNLNDLEWLERVARAHEAVLDRALAATTVIPLRLCTIYEDLDSVRRMLESEHERLAQVLELLRGRQEYGVKLLVDRGQLMEAARARSPEAPDEEGRSEGGAYLLRRRAERELRSAADSLAAELAEQVHARLQDWAIDAVTRPAQNRELSGHEGEMLLNAAYLVEADRVDELRALVAELEAHHAALGARIELTGPWPPYNFVPAEDS